MFHLEFQSFLLLTSPTTESIFIILLHVVDLHSTTTQVPDWWAPLVSSKCKYINKTISK